MKIIDYRVTFCEGSDGVEIVRVYARDINSGFTKAVKEARKPLGSGRVRELSRIEFWMVA